MKLALRHAKSWSSADLQYLHRAYSVHNANEAWSLLKGWLRLAPSQERWPSPPGELGPELLARIEKDLVSDAIATKTDYFPRLLSRRSMDVAVRAVPPEAEEIR
jgi:hypothetical protein